MFTYQQSTGDLSKDGVKMWTGYSGNGEWMNNPAAQDVHMHGPLPQGKYSIGHPETHEHLGPIAMRLTQSPENEMFGRDGFFIHADNAQANHSASDGCIVLPMAVRIQIGQEVAKGNNQLEVIA